ncbi:MAG: hypothetical protein EZS28_012444 [Streblomastix strix]|uniref:Uncharacterized protein n=1 Tax=Streblomastix strix TaxID=222440 RepID=A0A5J4WAP8_9EUKA|nr:MAG: hypothetical protein EZS28_012444 [Streblomastix strix]
MPSLFDKEVIISLPKSIYDVTQIQNSFITLEFTMNLLLDNKFDQFSEIYKEGTYIFNGLKNLAEVIRKYVLYYRGKTVDGSLKNDATTESFIYNTIKPKSEKNNRFVHSFYESVYKDDISCCGRYISIKATSDAFAAQTAAPYVMPVNFKVSIPLDDLLIFSAFSEYSNSLLGDLKIQFKINPNSFVFCQVDTVISMVKFYKTNKDEVLSSGQDKFKDIDLIFHKWSLTFQYNNMYIQIGCTADLITGVRAEELTPSGLKNLVCDIKLVIVPEFSSGAALTGLRTSQTIPLSHNTDICLIFPKYPRQATFFKNPCYLYMKISNLDRNFPVFPMNTLNEQFFTMQLAANNLDNIFEVTDEYEDSLTTTRGNSTRRYNSVTDYTSFFITLQCERNSNGAVDTYYNVDTNGKHPPPPIQCTVHDTFWLFTPLKGGSCVFDTTHSFDEVIGQVTA